MNLMWALTYTLVTVSTASITYIVLRHVTYDMGSRKDVDAFRYFLISFMIFILSNGVCIWANYRSISILGTFFTIINLTAICATAYLWFMYIEIRLNPYRAESKAFRYLSFIPMLVAIAMIATTGVTHLVIYYDETGQYSRGPAYSVILVSSFFYLIYATAQAYHSRRYAKTTSLKREYNYLMIFIVFPFLAGGIDFLYAHLPSMELTVLFGIILIYLNLQQGQVYRDALTGLNNRRLTDEYLSERLHFVSDSRPLYYFLADIDEYKQINDRFGHVEGDNALKIVAKVLKRFTDIEHYYISRWGGDEFVMIIDQDEEFDPEAFRRRLNDEIEREVSESNLPYDIKLSVGYVTCTDPKVEIDTVINTADQYMYREKNKNRQNGGLAGATQLAVN